MFDQLPAGTVTFLFTDIEGSTPLWEREPEQMQQALARHHAIVHEAVAAHGGYTYKIIGDAFQAAFHVSGQAVRAALAAQRALAVEIWATSVPLRVRMGLHAGQASPLDGDYATTHTLNRVARIMSAAHGGQVLLSDAVAELVRDDLPAAAVMRDMGKHTMKGMTQREHLFQVVVPDLPADFPPLNTLDVSSGNLPTQLTSFVGRRAELSEVKELLAFSRLITLTGSGGCGKTRLAIQVAADVQTAYAHGVWLVELTPLADPELVPQAVVAALRLTGDGHRSWLEVLIDFLHSRTLLLVLDNCEHVIEACAQNVDALLRACPNLRILASSREALGVAGEVAYRVPSLAVPEPALCSQSTRLIRWTPSASLSTVLPRPGRALRSTRRTRRQ